MMLKRAKNIHHQRWQICREACIDCICRFDSGYFSSLFFRHFSFCKGLIQSAQKLSKIITRCCLITWLIVAMPLKAENNICENQTTTCFGVNWVEVDSNEVMGVDVTAKDQIGNSPLHWAARLSNSTTVINTLLQAKADVHSRNEDGLSPLHLAARYNTIEIAFLLIKQNNVAYLTETNKKTEWVGKYYVNVRDKEDKTPLHYATLNTKNPNMISLLIALGANMQVKDIYQQTPFDYAKRNSDIYWRMRDLGQYK